VYQRLADLYRRLGRPDAAHDTLAKMAALATTDEARATMAERSGQFDEAAALYKKIAETQPVNVPGPWAQVNALQSIARMYQNNQEYDKAAATLHQTITVLQNSGKPEAANQVASVRQNLGNLYQQAGNVEAAEQTFQQAIAQAPAEMRFQAVSNYASFLGSTKRAGQGEQLIRDYMDSGAIKQPWEESNAWMMLAQLARQGGDPKRADEYQSVATAKQQALQTRDNVDRVTVQPLFQKAQAAGSGHPEEAFALTLEGMRQATSATDRESVVHFVGPLASSLAGKNWDKAQQLYDRLFVLVDGWMEQTRNPSLTARQQYVRFLFRPGHWEEAADAIASYREALISAHGEGTGWTEEIFSLTVDLERGRNSGKALPAARDLLALEESLAGKSSEPCLRGLEVLASVTEQTDDYASALPLRRRAIAISDLVYLKTDTRRPYVRLAAAQLLSRLGQLDEAEQMLLEAIAIGKEVRPPQPNLFQSELGQIQRRKAALAQQR
jgi:tetratricopeptide (TPR) repeat protein